jgi:hypothetical protein
MRLLAAPPIFLPMLLLAACKPSFDKRYDDAEKNIRTQASDIDSELAEKQRKTAQETQQPETVSSSKPQTRPGTDSKQDATPR